MTMAEIMPYLFLSIQAQDFIEESEKRAEFSRSIIPEHSSSGLH